MDVIKTVHTYWAADMLVIDFNRVQHSEKITCFADQCGIPLKTKANPRGRYTVNEVFDMFADLVRPSSYCSLDTLAH